MSSLKQRPRFRIDNLTADYHESVVPKLPTNIDLVKCSGVIAENSYHGGEAGRNLLPPSIYPFSSFSSAFFVISLYR
jgi:hypothetical protein